jgi:hypothetical protein
MKVGDKVRVLYDGYTEDRPNDGGLWHAFQKGSICEVTFIYDDGTLELRGTNNQGEPCDSLNQTLNAFQVAPLCPPQFAQPQPATIEPPFEDEPSVELCDEYERVAPHPPLNVLPSTSSERKAIPITSGVLDYFPAALAEVAKVSKAGNDQHNPGEPLHHARGKSMDHADCLLRHLIERGTLDTDGLSHTGKLAWRALALLQEECEANGAPLPRGAR